MKPAQLTQVIADKIPSMRKSEAKVANLVLQNPLAMVEKRIVDIAEDADVSEPTVVRFCRAIGCKGFQDFKLSLAQQLAASPSFGQIAVKDSDSTKELSQKVFDSTVDSLLKVRDNLNLKNIDRAIRKLNEAKRVEFYGFGASAAVAADAQHKFFRLRINSVCYSDPHLQNMSASSLGKDDVVIAISQSGKTQALIDSIKLVQKQGGIVIGIAPSFSPVANRSDIPLEIDAEEEFQIYTPLSSRIAQLTIIDTLTIGVAQKKGDDLRDHLRRLQIGLRSLRCDQEA